MALTAGCFGAKFQIAGMNCQRWEIEFVAFLIWFKASSTMCVVYVLVQLDHKTTEIILDEMSIMIIDKIIKRVLEIFTTVHWW